MGKENSLIRKAYRFLKKIKENAIGRMFDGWMLDQQIPLQSVFRSRFEYDVQEYGEIELYAPTITPDNPTKDLKNLKLHYIPQAIPKPYFYYLKDAVVLNRQIVDPVNPRRVILESFPEGSMQDEARNFRPELATRRKALSYAKSGSANIQEGYLFSGLWWKNYYHFLMDSCLRFVDLEDQGAFTKNTTLLLHSKPNAWQDSYLRLLGLDERNRQLTDYMPLKVRKLLISSPRRHRFVVSPRAIDGLRSRLFKNLGMADVEPTRKVFISRRGAKFRRILNEAEVEGCLLQHGFEILNAEKKSVEDQIKLFSQSKTIVAPHGAGLTNMIFSRRPTIIELFPADRWNIGYFVALTNSISGTHVPVICAPENEADDFNVDLHKLKTALNVI